ncbi:MAG: hypothetical protein M3258_04655 [Thermoproteota archaeon]|nr:hypothetical protein [Thermoproteota archaeon]
MRIVLAGVIAVLILLAPALASAQIQENYQTIKSQRSESFVLPYTATNRQENNPLVYTFDTPKQPSWILGIQNNLSYIPREGARTVIKIQEPAPSQKYIEIVMYGDQSRRFWVAVNAPDEGYARVYDSIKTENGETGWSNEGPITISHSENGGLSATNGQRTVVDQLDVKGFSVGSIAVYGNDKNTTLADAYAGNIGFDIAYGSFAQSQLYYVPVGLMAGVGALIAGLLIFKKRKSSD